jgi:integrase/recombinase XerD
MTPLRQRMLEDMQIRNLSPHTQRAYVENVARFARHFGRSPADLGPEEIRTYQVYLIRERHLAPGSLEVAVCALRFLYKVTLKQPWSFDDLIRAPKNRDGSQSCSVLTKWCARSSASRPPSTAPS